MIKAIIRSLMLLFLGILSLSLAFRNLGIFFSGDIRNLGIEWLLTPIALIAGIALMIPFFTLTKTLQRVKKKYFDEAYEQYKKENYKSAVPLLLKSANTGNSDAMFYLGRCYYEGYGVTQDYKKAVHWYRKAAKRNDAYAMNNLGVCYSNGYGVNKDIENAIYWYDLATKRGNKTAAGNLESNKKQLEYINKSLETGKTLSATITSIKSKKMVVSFANKKTGYIPFNEFSDEEIPKINEKYKIGDTIKAVVIDMGNGNNNIVLSKKRHDEAMKIVATAFLDYIIKQNAKKDDRPTESVKNTTIDNQNKEKPKEVNTMNIDAIKELLCKKSEDEKTFNYTIVHLGQIPEVAVDIVAPKTWEQLVDEASR